MVESDDTAPASAPRTAPEAATGAPAGPPTAALRAAGPLDGRSALFGEGLALAGRPDLGRLNLRAAAGDPAMAAALAPLGGAWPPPASTWIGLDAERQLAWLGPDEALLLCPGAERTALEARLRTALGDAHAAVTDVSDAQACLRLSGRSALDVLAKGCPLDLENLPAGSAVQTLLGHLDLLLLVQARNEIYDLHVRSTLAAYAWNWLADAAEEFL